MLPQWRHAGGSALPLFGQFFCRHSLSLDETQVKAWVLFFIALHDIGKFDTRFQLKSVETWRMLFQGDAKPSALDYSRCQEFDHGAAGLYWFLEDYQPMQEAGDFTCFDAPEPHPLHSWIPWIEAVTGHHGYIRLQHQLTGDKLRWPTFLPDILAERDRQARCEWTEVLEALFLKPVGLSVNDTPPAISPLMVGFCSIADWLGSWRNDDTFQFCAAIPDTLDQLRDYLVAKCEVFPAPAGINRKLPFMGSPVDSVPRASEDKPRLTEQIDFNLACSPRQRG